MRTIYLAAGCFWGTQRYFDQFAGVLSTQTGYANGRTENPSYEDVKHRHSGHAETVRIDYDENLISLTKLLEYYFMVIDPFSVNKQGEDEGEQYRTGIYYADPQLLPEIQAVMSQKEAELGGQLAVEVLPLRQFFPAEEYHQKYLEKNPTGYCHIPPAMFRLAASAATASAATAAEKPL
ncbi:MAG: peptide-methionine (S)-S-oxide reductase MsrA [Treponema sp.]|nr:peptide-methionine (S)-S-oxide reductase MsrA [Treponema sp.]